MNHRACLSVFGACVLACSILVTPGKGLAQDTDQAHPLCGGAWAIQFGISRDLTLGSFSGGILSVKRHYSEHSALRAGLSGGFESTDSEDRYAYPDTLIGNRSDLDVKRVGMELQYIYYARPSDAVSLFFGTGPSVSVDRYTQAGKRGGYEYTAKQDAWYVGSVQTLGAEWFVSRIIGIHAEYGLAVEYMSSSRSEDRTEDIGESKLARDSHGWRIASRPVRFGLSVYF